MPKFAGWNSPTRVKRVLQATLYLTQKRRKASLQTSASENEPPKEGEKNDVNS